LIRGGLGGQETDIGIEAGEMAKNRKRLSEILARHSGQSFAKVDADVERNFYLSADEAVAYGLVDRVVKMSKP
jgi:ATP-dependent Clp protease protease subunit